jgi:hypothetical protein
MQQDQSFTATITASGGTVGTAPDRISYFFAKSRSATAV